MRKVINVKIEGYDGQIEIRELTVKDIIDIAQSGQKKAQLDKEARLDAEAEAKVESQSKVGQTIQGHIKDGLSTLDSLKDFISSDFLPKVTNLKLQDLIEFPPSDLKTLYEKFKDVNSTFFEFAEAAGLGGLLGMLKTAIQTDFLKMLAS